ncbi:MAG TPA: nucleotidyltransferase family protein [Steroidobacteraceae bacterium]|nr:nucleotidyltransferase family protein [Steroidobacteraceae bacterium]
MSRVPVTHAMLLAAGRGERMRPLTDRLPKPLVPVRGKPLIVYHLEKLAALGVQNVVINLAWLGTQVREALGAGERWGLSLRYSDEGAQALDVGGGIFRALPWLGDAPFLVISADIFTDLDFATLSIDARSWAQLLLVANPQHHRGGDFALAQDRVIEPRDPQAPRPWTYGGIGLFRRELFAGCQAGRFPLLPALRRAMAQQRLGGQTYAGPWCNVGTLQQLNALQRAGPSPDGSDKMPSTP